MTNQHQFLLIDGTFTPSEASQIILSLINSKMHYHTMEKLSNEERFGRDSSHSEKRLRQLAELKKTVKEILASAETTKRNLKVEGRLEITLI